MGNDWQSLGAGIAVVTSVDAPSDEAGLSASAPALASVDEACSQAHVPQAVAHVPPADDALATGLQEVADMLRSLRRE